MSGLRTIGIDRRGNDLYRACVTCDAGRPEVLALDRFDRGELHESRHLDGEKLVLSVPDSQVLVKRLRLSEHDGPDIRERCRFELAQSVLEPENMFQFDLLAANDDHCRLGLIYRRERLENLLPEYHLEGEPAGVEYLIRAAALGRGYLSFCRQIPGELVALVDFTDDLASICFVHHKRLVELTHLVLGGADLSSESSLKRIAVELRTVVNFKLASFADRGTNLPLAGLVLNGSQVDERVQAIFVEYFPVGVSTPEIHLGFIGDTVDLKGVSPENYLVALGLTVN